MMRTLSGYSKITMHEFSGENLSAVLSEAALYIAGIERDFPEIHLDQQWDSESDKYILFVYEQYSGQEQS